MKTQPMYVGFHREFSQREKSSINKAVRLVSSDVSKMFGSHASVDVIFFRSGQMMRGLAQKKDRIIISIPRGKINYVQLEAVLYHELHHIVRGYTEYLNKGSHFLLNSLLSEGLAMALEIEKRPKSGRVMYGTCSETFARKWFPKMKKELYKTKYDYASWFHGKGKPDRLGYKIGTYLVNEVRNHHTKLTHNALSRKSARELLKLSNVTF